MEKNNKKAVFFLPSLGLMRISNLREFLLPYSIIKLNIVGKAKGVNACIGWGFKKTANKSRKFARCKNLPYIALEDGFLRSVLLGRDGGNPLSLVVDSVGIYYNARQTNLLEQWLEVGKWNDPSLLDRASNVRKCLFADRLSKYNHTPEKQLWPDHNKPRVLVVDQTFGDMSVIGGMADESSFQRMLQAALDENPDSEVIVRTHPDVVAGHSKGYLGAIPDHPRLKLLTDEVHPWSVLDGVHTVYTATSLLGFEALLAEKKVRCFGMPFYAGWGLTEDELTCPRRTRKPSLDEVFAAAYLKYARYVDPIKGKRCEIEQIIPLLSDRRRHFLQTDGIIVCSSVSRWKQKFLPSFLSQTRRNVKFIRSAEKAVDKASDLKGRWVLWASKETEELRKRAETAGVGTIRVEDAFLRSVGLGSDLVRPWSLVLDDEGIYYDCSRPSRLETLLRETDFSSFLIERAQKVLETILRQGLTKYNVGDDMLLDLPRDGRSLVLVPGQVEDDASILRGSPEIRRNSDLLRLTREARPDAFVIYKPHPDVLVGNRRGVVTDKETAQWADTVITDISMDRLLAEVDEVHTMTSLTGFEALLRNKKVTCYGLPFYAGWGLTEDRLSCDRRGRPLTIDQLVAAALILYPTYVDPKTEQICTVEHMLEWMTENKGQPAGPPWKTRLIRWFQHWRQGR